MAASDPTRGEDGSRCDARQFRKPTLTTGASWRDKKIVALRQALARRHGPGHGHAARRPARSRARCSRSRPHARRMARISAFPARRAASPLFRKNTLDEMTVRRTEKPLEGTLPPRVAEEEKSDLPLKRERAGIGSYEDPAEARNQGRRSKKTGRPGR